MYINTTELTMNNVVELLKDIKIKPKTKKEDVNNMFEIHNLPLRLIDDIYINCKEKHNWINLSNENKEYFTRSWLVIKKGSINHPNKYNIPNGFMKCSCCNKIAKEDDFVKSNRGYKRYVDLCRKCKNKKGKIYRDKNKEHYREYRSNHKEETKKYMEEYYDRNREHLKEKQK